MVRKRLTVSFLAVAGLYVALTAQSRGAGTPPSNEWRTYGADLATTKAAFKDMVRNDIAPGIAQFLFHPSDEDPLLRLASPSSAVRRIDIDREIFRIPDRTDPSWDRDADIHWFLEQSGVVLADWRVLAARHADPCVPATDSLPYVKPAACPP